MENRIYNIIICMYVSLISCFCQSLHTFTYTICIHRFYGRIRGIAQLLFLSMHNASLMTYPVGSQLNTVCLHGWHVTKTRRRVSHATAPCRRYLFNLRVLLCAVFSSVAAIYFDHDRFPHFF